MNKDLSFGTSKELFIMNILNNVYNLNLKRSEDKYAIFDFYDDKKKVAFELKSRRVKKNTYPTIMIGFNKISKGLNLIEDGWKVGLCFYFENCICTFKLTKDFNMDWVKHNYTTRWDRGRDEVSSVALIPNNNLKKIIDFELLN